MYRLSVYYNCIKEWREREKGKCCTSFITQTSQNGYPVILMTTMFTSSSLFSQCSFLPRFLIQIDTTYQDNNGSSENALNLSPDLLEQREIDHVDILSDEFSSRETTPEEDCHTFVSSKTGRGPLQEGWKVSSYCCCKF